MAKVVVKVTAKFVKDTKKLLTTEDLDELYDYLSENPTAGPIIRSTGGVRKLRWSPKKSNKGKSGSLRILYHYSNNILVIMLGAFSKSEIENISEAEKNTLRKILPELVEQIMEDL
ncbi:MAG: addiction module toxin RelE [Cyanobacteria bacterium]|nr:addiction module toxin RelE [Cyanobacteriota bacterium]MDA1020292.1 addiction module toxin RelE [Cyanobacteriota bacterium]